MDFSATSVIREFSYLWNIHVKDLFTDHEIYSPTFHCPNIETGIWVLEMIGCQDANGELCVRLGIRLHNESSPVNGRVKFSISGTEFQSSEVFAEFQPIEPGETASVTYNLPLHVITKWANGKVEDQNLVVNLHMWLLLPSITVPMINVETEEDKQVVMKLKREDIWETRNKMKSSCDVTIRCLHHVMTMGEVYHDRVTWSGQAEHVTPATNVTQEVIETGTSKFINYFRSDSNSCKIKSSSSIMVRGRDRSSRLPRRCPSSGGNSPSRGINAVRAGFLSAREAESLGLGRMDRRGGSEGDNISSADLELNDDRSIDADPAFSAADINRGWIIDPFGPSEITHSPRHDPRAADGSSGRRHRSISPNNPQHIFQENNYVEFKVHRSVLCFRSPVFQQMLADQSLDFIEVMDTEALVMEELLRFLYTGAVRKEIMPALAEGLLSASSKYEVLHLKSQCEEILITTLTPENTCRILVQAEKNRASTLKEGIHKFALKEFRDIFRTPEFRQFRAEHAVLANEFLMSIFQRSSASQL